MGKFYIGPACHTNPSREGVAYSYLITTGSEQELIDFGRKLGLMEKWLKNRGSYSVRFELCPDKRKRAIHRGAVEVSEKEYEEILTKRLREWVV